MASVSIPSAFLLQRPSPCSLCPLSFHQSQPFISSPLRFRSGDRSSGIRFSICRASASVTFRDLEADDFRHPLDKQNTLLLRAIPGLNEFGKALLGPVAEQVMVLENIGTSVLVTENQLSDLHQLMLEAARVLNIEAPDLYAVFAHELGHLKCDHGVWLTFANILTLGAYSVPGLGGLIAQSLEEQLYRWIRAAELTCDRAALLVAQDPKVVISVLMKLAGGCPSLADQLNVDAFLEQARSYDKASSSPVGWYIRNAQTRQLSHPLPVLRAREIDQCLSECWCKYTLFIAKESRKRKGWNIALHLKSDRLHITHLCCENL
ncbi:hypothetical protein MRB53_007855 [Persea americana]|uniref:Uncharacterized protein n=1 Tax=Persea americana TaxID=3435 RepID=A0ACC2MK29_PERAE|nr:hypothetical protein MRB53_007855 [Persea americana]